MAYCFTDDVRQEIAASFGEPFFHRLTDALARFSREWMLEDVEIVPSFSAKCVFFCRSRRWGDTVLSIAETLRTECTALREFGGAFCRVYEADLDAGAMMTERILPGTVLRSIPETDKRVRIFCELYQGIHVIPADAGAYPTYMEWVEKITAYMKNRADFPVLYAHMRRACEICAALWTRYPRRMLLHGDFHHDNILYQAATDSWRIIDPKGVTGDPLFDLPRFILNEYTDECTPAAVTKITDIVQNIAALLAVPALDLARALYVETAMSECWCVEDGDQPTMPNLHTAEMVLAAISSSQ